MIAPGIMSAKVKCSTSKTVKWVANFLFTATVYGASCEDTDKVTSALGTANKPYGMWIPTADEEGRLIRLKGVNTTPRQILNHCVWNKNPERDMYEKIQTNYYATS